jgi:hypothetical protein
VLEQVRRAPKQAWDWLTLPRLTVILVVGAVLAVAVSAVSDALDAWMPNVAIEALAIALTITVVDRIVRREAHARVQPLLDHAYSDINGALTLFGYQLVREYAHTHEAHYRRPPTTQLVGLTEFWLQEQQTADLLPADNDSVVRAAETLARQFDATREANPELEPTFRVAMDACARTLRHQGTMLALFAAMNVQGLAEEPYATSARGVVVAVRDFGREFQQRSGLVPQIQEEILGGIEVTREADLRQIRQRRER